MEAGPKAPGLGSRLADVVDTPAAAALEQLVANARWLPRDSEMRRDDGRVAIGDGFQLQPTYALARRAIAPVEGDDARLHRLDIERYGAGEVGHEGLAVAADLAQKWRAPRQQRLDQGVRRLSGQFHIDRLGQGDARGIAGEALDGRMDRRRRRRRRREEGSQTPCRRRQGECPSCHAAFLWVRTGGLGPWRGGGDSGAETRLHRRRRSKSFSLAREQKRG